ncbi:hypothetical protein BV22DRAFT_1131298 [Leucogyrophana mollusca]|uniref:Uncharacterized protein n=1 Tax=Leucogyrophana mollusca TaxID=85980 RepID=A0ACB8BCP5_9AGAM|nr:hypothetical protein BV22DRAFT_1131298 [Leucogyrophana mollusca]
MCPTAFLTSRACTRSVGFPLRTNASVVLKQSRSICGASLHSRPPTVSGVAQGQAFVRRNRADGPCGNIWRRWATSTTPHSSASDPAEVEAMQCLEQGTQKLEEGDVQGAKDLYKRSVEIKRNASSLFNLGVTHYHLKEFDDAIAAWKESISLQPASADAHTSDIAASLSPEDPEIAFNLAAVLEATGQLEEALKQYKRSKENGVERAAMHIRNVSAKILGKTMQAAENAEKSGSRKKSDS